MVLCVAFVVACLSANTARAATSLPDNRGYELVSPPEKNGADVMAFSARTHAAAFGDAAVFTSLGAFGEVQGTGIDVDYLALRTATPGTQGWVTHAITPRQEALTLQPTAFGNQPNFEAVFTHNLDRGVYRSWGPLTDVPNLANVGVLYLRDNLRAGNGGSLLLSNAVAPLDPHPTLRIVPVGASTDLSHVIFESQLPLTPEVPPIPPFPADQFFARMNVYESVNGNVRLASVLPDGSSAASRAGFGGGFYPMNLISGDGSRVFFVSRGRVYMRVNGSTTMQLNASEKSAPESPQPATLWLASEDGSRAFMITSEGLIDGDDDGVPDVYMYDADAATGAHLTRLSIDREPSDGHFTFSVVGASADGHYVYFVSGGQLVAGEPAGVNLGLYLWHDGNVTFIGSFPHTLDSDRNGPRTPWGTLRDTLTARVTPDGRHLLFMTTSDAGFRGRGGFGGYDHGHTCTFEFGAPVGDCRELYVYEADSGRLACASCQPTGATARFDALLQIRAGASAAIGSWHMPHALSDDGRRVFFNTAEALVPQDSNGKFDAYEYDVATGVVHLISTGTYPADSYFLDASENGDDVFVVTRERLVGWDVDDNYDLYDARVNGGVPDPVAPAPACTGDACRGQHGEQPISGAPASETFRGRGDAAHGRKAAKKRKRCRGRMVRRKHGTRVRCRQPKHRKSGTRRVRTADQRRAK